MKIYLDLETRSRVDLRKSNVYRYAADPDFRILMLAYAVEDGPVELVLDEGDMRRLVEAWIAEGHTLVAHNASFERIALSRLLGLDRKSTRLNSSHVKISYAVSRLKQKQR